MTEGTRDWYLRAARELAATSPRQVEWCFGVAHDDRVLALLDALPRPARQPSLLFAVAAYLGVPDAPYAVWADAVLARAEDLARELPRRRVQTNEPGRCVPLLVALAHIPGPIALVELGASAGLCLLPDRYGYRFRTPDGEAGVALGDGSPVLEARLDAVLVPDALPDIRWRRGVDLAPLDARDADDARWLEASLPPDRPERRERLRAALAAARAHPVEVVAGDALAALPAAVADALAALPAAATASATLVVATLGTAVYLPPADRERLLAAIAGAGGRAVTFEARGALPEVTERWAALAAEGRADAAAGFVLALDGVPLASGSPHGDVLEAVRPPAGRPGTEAHRS
ncbi:DUF2332 family protein [Protaetiibacter sp. SSC-01]|uniref:DUF2332 family protein n=1 Tax=Protaetiibacter sp. SSC-01 TaxID=2759943 RepID=UPI0016572DB6|nr:DUF2332 family protein [Protaetiibacter sp. SSC-01]QNO37965.1 DUF2332 family protein [Protaetiibacter sp. SSC-01]